MFFGRGSARWFLFANLLMASALLGACSSDSGSTVDGIHLVNKGKLSVCTHLPYKPFEFTGNSGDVVGFDVDLVGLLAKNLGVDLNVISIEGAQITSGAVFSARLCDMAMGGFSITAKRKQAVAFSHPYFNATQALLVKKGQGIDSLQDMRGKKLGVMANTTGDLYARKHGAEGGYERVEFDDLALMVNAVSSGKVAAAIQDSGPLAYYAEHHDDTRVATTFDTGEHYGFIFAKNSENATKLREKFNKILAKARKDGSYKARYNHWFGDTTP